MKFRRIAVIAVIGIFVATFFLYGYYPVTVTNNLKISDKQFIMYNNYQSRPASFSNVTIPENAIYVEIDVSMNTTLAYQEGSSPIPTIIGLFSINNSSYALQRAGSYQPAKGYYEILITQMSYSIKEPVFNRNGSVNLSKFVYDNYTFLGKSYEICLDPNISFEPVKTTISWVKIIYKYKRF